MVDEAFVEGRWERFPKESDVWLFVEMSADDLPHARHGNLTFMTPAMVMS